MTNETIYSVKNWVLEKISVSSIVAISVYYARTSYMPSNCCDIVRNTNGSALALWQKTELITPNHSRNIQNVLNTSHKN